MSSAADSSLLGMDPEMWKQLQAMSSQMGPTAEDRKTAMNHAIIAGSLGLLANANKPAAMGIGAGGLLWLNSYNDELKQMAQQRGANIGQAGQVYNLAKQAQMMNMGMAAYNGTDAPQAPQGSPQPGPAGLPQVGQAPPPNMRDRMARLGLVQGIAKGDVVPAAKFMFPDAIPARPGAPIVSPIDGGVLNANAAPPPGHYYDPTTKSYLPVGNNQAFQQMAGATAGAVTGAQEQAKAPYEITTLQTPSGQTVQMPKSAALQNLSKAAPQAFNNMVNPTPGQNAAIASDAMKSGYQLPQMGQPPQQLGVGPNPIAQAQAKSTAESTGTALADFEKGVHERAQTAEQSDATLSRMKQYMSKFQTSATMPMRSEIANYALDVPAVGESLANTLVPNAKTALPAIQAFNKLVVGMTAEQSKVFGSREAQQVVQMVKSAQPNIGMVPGAPQTVMEFISGVNDYNKATEQALNAWKAQHSGSPDGFQEYWHATSPITKFVPPLSYLDDIASGKPPGTLDKSASAPAAGVGAQIPDAASAYLKANPQTRAAFDSKYGQGAAQSVLGK